MVVLLAVLGSLPVVSPAVDGCTDCDGDGFAWPADCNDADPGAYPGAPEECDGRDNDCDGLLDDGPACDTTCDSPARIGVEVRLTDETASSVSPALARNGAGYGIAWEDRRGGVIEQVWFARLSIRGVKLEPEAPMTFAANPSHQPDLVWTGTEYGLVWSRQGNLFFTRINAAGTQLGLEVQVTTEGNAAWAPHLVWTGSEYGVAWQDARDGNEEIYFARLDAGGTRIGADVRVTSDPGSSTAPRLAWTGTEYGIAWEDDRDGNEEIYFARLDATGVKLGADTRVTDDSAISNAPDVVWNGGEYGLVWRDRRNGNGEIYFALLSAAGVKIGSDVRVTDAADNSSQPRLGWTGTEYGVAWRDGRDGNTETYFARLDGLGLKIGDDLRLTADDASSSEPALAWNGVSYGVAWVDSRDGDEEVYFTRAGCNCETDEDDDGFTPCDEDCDDGDDQVYPGAPQLCDRLNNDCNDPVWPELPPDESDDDTDSLAECEGDCDDTRDFVLPGLDEICDSLDNDCDDEVDEGFDLDLDGWTTCGGDCDDTSEAVYPGAEQVCDGLNNNCYHVAWPALSDTNDGDDDEDGLSECAGDCDDEEATVRPGLIEACDFLDNDCDGPVDEDFDTDADGYTTCGGDCDDGNGTVRPWGPQLCGDGLNNDCNHGSWPGLEGTNEWDDDADELTECAGDCDDTRGNVRPGLVEVCDLLDNNCDTWVDEGFDTDLDSWTSCGGDCDDGNGDVFPGAPQLCDGVHNDCEDPAWPVPPADETTDSDLDGFLLCADCDDADGMVFPGAEQVCDDGLNNDCHHPEWPLLTYTNDSDDDGDGLTDCEGDCRDGDPLAFPGSSEVCNGADDDCDGRIDERLGCGPLCAAPYSPGPDIALMATDDRARAADLVWTGSEIGLAWHDNRDGNLEIYFTRLDAGGSRIMLDQRITETTHRGGTNPALAWTGTEYGLIWRRDDVYFTRLSAGGTPMVDAHVIGSQASGIDLVWNGAAYGYIRVQGDDEEIHFSLLDATGLPLGSDVSVSTDTGLSLSPATVWTGSEFGLAWQDDADGDNEIYFTRLDASGTIIGSTVQVTSDPAESTLPAVAWNGTGYGILWVDDRTGNEEVYFAALDDLGNKAGGDVQVTSVDLMLRDFRGLQLAWTGEEFVATWADNRSGPLRVYFARLDAAGGKRSDDIEVSKTPNSAIDPVAVWNGVSLVAVWSDDRVAPRRIYLNRLLCGCSDDDADGHSTCLGDNCPAAANPLQQDLDADETGDACDLDDGYQRLEISEASTVNWQAENGFDSFNLYRGALAVLRSDGFYTQMPGSHPLAARDCAVPAAPLPDTPPLNPGEFAFYLSTGNGPGGESSLGLDSNGAERPNNNACSSP
jgi:hypothetical protein